MPILHGQATRPTANHGDLVIVQEKYNSVTAVKLSRGEYLNNRYGRFAHDDIIGKPLGRRWEAKSHPGAGAGTQQCAGFVHAFAPTPELWSMAMMHRTQIVYPHDFSIIALHLDLRPGCVLVEAGTGSGSASIAFARVLAPHGRVRSFEFHEPRAEAACKDFEALGVGDIIQVNGGVDVVKSGFVGVQDGSADAVFLDLPAPYLMGKEVARVLKPNGTVCTFSPCVEQVQRSVEMFRKGPFHSVKTVTATVKTFETREQILGAPGFARTSADEDGYGGETDSSGQEGPRRKRMRREAEVVTSTKRKSRTAGAERLAMAHLSEGRHEGRVIRVAARLHSKPYPSMKGHTSYLTFARRGRGEGDGNPCDGQDGERVGGEGDTAGHDGKSGDRRSCSVS